jgi:hypothetical protein
MAGIQWIKRGGRHRDVRGREKEKVADEQIEDALAKPKSRSKSAGIRLAFTGRLQSVGPKGAWTGLFLTPAQSARLGTKSRVPVTGSLNGFLIRGFLAPMGDGTHGLMVNKQMQAGAKAGPGDAVRVVLAVDHSPRKVDVPKDLERALARSRSAKAFFQGLSYTHRKDYASWVAEAKRPETRRHRVEESIRLLEKGRKWRDR